MKERIMKVIDNHMVRINAASTETKEMQQLPRCDIESIKREQVTRKMAEQILDNMNIEVAENSYSKTTRYQLFVLTDLKGLIEELIKIIQEDQDLRCLISEDAKYD